MEQAEVGLRPTLLALRCAEGLQRILQVSFALYKVTETNKMEFPWEYPITIFLEEFMEDANNKSVRFNALTGDKFEKVALKLGRNKRLVFMQMVDYFYRSKKDPLDVNDELLKNTLLKNHRDYIGFIKTQETDLLIPTKREVDRMIHAQKKLLDYFNTHIIRHNENLLNNQRLQQHKFSKSDEIILLVSTKLDNKEKLKNKFLYILENYIRVRDSFTVMTRDREREELINKTIQQVNQL